MNVFKMLMASGSPLTGDQSSSWPILLFVIAAVVILAVLFLLKKK